MVNCTLTDWLQYKDHWAFTVTGQAAGADVEFAYVVPANFPIMSTNDHILVQGMSLNAGGFAAGETIHPRINAHAYGGGANGLGYFLQTHVVVATDIGPFLSWTDLNLPVILSRGMTLFSVGCTLTVGDIGYISMWGTYLPVEGQPLSEPTPTPVELKKISIFGGKRQGPV